MLTMTNPSAREALGVVPIADGFQFNDDRRKRDSIALKSVTLPKKSIEAP